MTGMGEVSGEQPYKDGYVQLRDGLRMHYRDYPGGSDLPPILCLHGLNSERSRFRGIRAALFAALPCPRGGVPGAGRKRLRSASLAL